MLLPLTDPGGPKTMRCGLAALLAAALPAPNQCLFVLLCAAAGPGRPQHHALVERAGAEGAVRHSGEKSISLSCIDFFAMLC